MYYIKKQPKMANRKLITISLPPLLLKKAEALAEEENRTKSELLREALRFYIETRPQRKRLAPQSLSDLISRIQARTKSVPASRIRSVIREAVGAARGTKQLSG